MMYSITIRAAGLILFLVGTLIMSIPFFLFIILLGIDKTNTIMWTVMHVPLNMLSYTKNNNYKNERYYSKYNKNNM